MADQEKVMRYIADPEILVDRIVENARAQARLLNDTKVLVKLHQMCKQEVPVKTSQDIIRKKLLERRV